MQLYLKLEIISQFFSKFLKSTSHFEDFKKKDEPHSLRFSEVIESKRRAYLIV